MKKELDELKDITEMIRRFIASNKHGVAFVCNFVAFTEKGDVKDNASRILAFGSKGMTKIMLDELKEVTESEVDEDDRDCTTKNIPARTYFIKECHKQCVPIPTIGSTLGDRTEECIESYIAGNNGVVS